jgi:ketosteroid isomerase-like protein
VGVSDLRALIDRYNDAWNRHDVDAIVALHAPDMVFENHTAGECAEGEEVREHIARIFAGWPDIAFATRRLYVREGLLPGGRRRPRRVRSRRCCRPRASARASG